MLTVRERGARVPLLSVSAGSILGGKRFTAGELVGLATGLGWALLSGLSLFHFFILKAFSFSI